MENRDRRMNGHTAARLSTHAVSRIVDAIALERAGKPAHQIGDWTRLPQRQDRLSRTGGASSDLGSSRISVIEVGGRSRNASGCAEEQAMKQRLMKHMLWAVAIVLAFMAWHVVSKM